MAQFGKEPFRAATPDHGVAHRNAHDRRRGDVAVVAGDDASYPVVHDRQQPERFQQAFLRSEVPVQRRAGDLGLRGHVGQLQLPASVAGEHDEGGCEDASSHDWVYGQWVGEERIEGNHVTDCDKPENARHLHQLRDLLVRVEDPVGGGVGLGNAETFALGAFPERGLTAENSFL
jgi:hypothetical protein